jgi:probable rRNA maturation factor
MAGNLFPGAQVALRVLDSAAIQGLNREFRRVDQPTDVLSFPADRDSLARGHAGDIALSWNAVLAQAAQNGNSPEAEACALLAHGLLHLAGYDHDTDEADAEMTERTLALCRLAGYEVSCFGH